MTKKHFILLAQCILHVRATGKADLHTLALVTNEIAKACQIENPRFSLERFIEACGMVNLA